MSHDGLLAVKIMKKREESPPAKQLVRHKESYLTAKLSSHDLRFLYLACFGKRERVARLWETKRCR